MHTESASIHVLGAAAAAPAASAQLISLGELQDAAGRPVAQAALRSPPGGNPLHAVRARLQVCVGAIHITLGELLAAREQQVLTLDRGVEEPVDLVLEGRVVARGQLVAVDGHFGLRILELPAPLRP